MPRRTSRSVPPARPSKSLSRHLATAGRVRAPQVRYNKQLRDRQPNAQLPFTPPEDWHEPTEGGHGYRFVVQPPGDGFRHVLTPAEIRARLAQVPPHFLDGLEVVHLGRMTRKKQSFPCYGMQWGATIYLYPIEESLSEYYRQPPRPAERIEAEMHGGRWIQQGKSWQLVWTEDAICDFYLNNILLHELAHLIDDRNTSYAARERYAEAFAIRHGYLPSRRQRKRKVVRRHHAV